MIENSVKTRSIVERKLRTLHGNAAIPSVLVDFIAQVLKLQQEAMEKVNPPVLPEQRVVPREKQLMGAALLSRELFVADMENAQELFGRLLQVMKKAGGVLGKGVLCIETTEVQGGFSRKGILTDYIVGRTDVFEAMSACVPETPKLLDFLVAASLAPSLEVLARELSSLIDMEKTWNYGHCPVCGSLPLMARLEGKEGFRMLTCSFCHHEYKAKRLQCPYCLEEDTKKLRYFTSNDDTGYQVHVCDSCQSYVKVADFRNLDRISYPILDDLESLALDVAAAHEGFVRPTTSAWGF